MWREWKGGTIRGMGGSPGYGMRLMFRRLWVRIPALYTGWAFFTFICGKNCIVCFQKTKIKEKEAGDGHFKKTVPSKSPPVPRPKRGHLKMAPKLYQEQAKAGQAFYMKEHGH